MTDQLRRPHRTPDVLGKMASLMKMSQSAAFSRKAMGAAPRARAPVRRAVAVRAGPLIGGKAPDFTAPAVFDQEFMDVTLSKYKGKYVVLFFYPVSPFSHHNDRLLSALTARRFAARTKLVS